jgi:isopentenyl diphosphate isomerase/L-lactate dehydrogenase-like FMN-dependent dehydrogenase
MKKQLSKLTLNRETLRQLKTEDTSQAVGGGYTVVPVPCAPTGFTQCQAPRSLNAFC